MRCTHTNFFFRKISSVTVRCPRATTASRLVADTPISRDIFCGDLTAGVETKDVEKTWNLLRRLAAVSSAGLVYMIGNYSGALQDAGVTTANGSYVFYQNHLKDAQWATGTSSTSAACGTAYDSFT